MSLPSGVGGVRSLARVCVPPSSTFTSADVHASFEGIRGVSLLRSQASWADDDQGIYTSPVTGFSGQNEVRVWRE